VAILSERFKALSYLVKPKPYGIEKPVALQFPVIDICNSQCQMCRIWENKKSTDISHEELRRGLRNPLYSEVASVGLNGGEPTLRKDLGQLAAVLFEELPKLRAISLITNAYKYSEVIDRITDVGNVVKKHGGMLDVMVSLDGFGEVHDRVRGKPGNFARAQKVIDFVQGSPLVSNVRIGCTIIKANAYGLADLFEYCQSKGLYIKYRLGIPHQRLYTQNLRDPYALTPEETYHVAEFLEGLIAHYEPGEQQRFFYRSLIDQMIHNTPRKAGCDWQHRGATITSKGELLYCAVQSKSLGKIQDSDSESLYFDNADHLQDIIASKCDTCVHDYVGIPPKDQYFRQLGKQVARKFRVESLARDLYRAASFGDFRSRGRFARRLAGMQALARAPLAPESVSGDRSRVMICGWYGTETLGDKAILGGVVDILGKALGPLDLTLVSLFPYVSEMTRRQMPELEGCHIVAPREGVRLAAAMDLVVFGGGPLMAIDELADMEAIFGAARAAGVATVTAGCGVGPLGSPWHDASLVNILLLATLRVYRDAKSRAVAGELGVDVAGDLVAEDPAFTWLHKQRPHLQARPPTDRKILLLGLRDFPYSSYAKHLGAEEGQQAKQRYEEAVLAALEVLCERHPDLVLRPLPMCTNHFGDDDRWFYRRLFRGNAKLQSRLDLSLLGAELPPIAYCEAFRSAHVALTMRFHSLVFALGLDLPAVAIDYTLGKGKVHALAERFGVPCRDLARLDAAFIVEELDRQLTAPAVQTVAFEPGLMAALVGSLPALVRGNRVQAA